MRTQRELRHLFGLAFLGALGAALITSKLYWGYFFTRPGLDDRIAGARTYLSVTTFSSEPTARTAARLIASKRDLVQLADLVETDPYDFSGYAVLVRLRERGLLERLPPMEPTRLESLLPLVRSTGKLVTPEPGYEARQYFGGLAVEALAQDGSPLLYLVVNGGEASNDHYPSYQLLFSGSGPSDWKLNDSTLFFFDIAGIEGLEWPLLTLWYFLHSFVAVLLWVEIRTYWRKRWSVAR